MRAQYAASSALAMRAQYAASSALAMRAQYAGASVLAMRAQYAGSSAAARAQYAADVSGLPNSRMLSASLAAAICRRRASSSGPSMPT
ncbi:hypothetical protein D3C72_1798940 [compost metagenome]